MTSTLDQLRQLSVVVADTADFQAIEQFKPVDATTNPSLILKQAQSPVTEGLISETKEKLANGTFQSAAEAALDLSVRFGFEISNRITGYISTEVDARLSFNETHRSNKHIKSLEKYARLAFRRSVY